MARLDELLRQMKLEGASDLHLTSGSAPYMRINGEMVKLKYRTISAETCEGLIFEILNNKQRELFKENWDLDLSYPLSGVGRFRVNVFMQRNGVSGVLRLIPEEIKTIRELDLPEQLSSLIDVSEGLVLVTGPTGSGKSTTLASLIHTINKENQAHIITVEDPIEFVHENQRCLISQREIASHTKSFSNALRAALREDPDIILVGEMRDRATVEVALMAAETGHLVLSTLHTVDAGQSINRILGLFSLGEEKQLRIRLADSLRYVISQRLAPKVGGGRQLLSEIMGYNLRTRETVALGEGEHRNFYEIIEASAPFGWMTFDQSILNAYENNLISEETAKLYASRKGRVSRGIDIIQKTRGLETDLDSGLRLDLPENAFH